MIYCKYFYLLYGYLQVKIEKNLPQLPEHVSITNEKRNKNEIKQYKIRLTFINYLLSGLLNVKSLISDDLHLQMEQFSLFLFCPFHLCCHDLVFNLLQY